MLEYYRFVTAVICARHHIASVQASAQVGLQGARVMATMRANPAVVNEASRSDALRHIGTRCRLLTVLGAPG
jgi:hypothetical protein